MVLLVLVWVVAPCSVLVCARIEEADSMSFQNVDVQPEDFMGV
jgi:hypothetical protein